MISSLTARTLACTSLAHTSVSYSSRLHEEIRCCICKLWLWKLSSLMKEISQGHFMQLLCYATQIARGFLESYVTEIWNFWIVNYSARCVVGLLYVPAELTLKNFTICPHSVFVFSMDLTTNNNYFPVQPYLISFIKETSCLRRGTSWNYVQCSIYLFQAPKGKRYILQSFLSISLLDK